MASDFDIQIDYYEVLQVHPKAEVAVIRSAYRAILRDLQNHPDLGGSHERAVVLNDAYRVLTDVQLRSRYDRAREELHRGNESKAEATPGQVSEYRYIVCPACGRRNRVPRVLGKAGARCGACRAQLMIQKAEETPGAQSQSNTLRLSKTLYQTLQTRGEIELRQDTAPRGGKITCRRCRRIWTAPVHCSAPHACPSCGATDWKSFRLFKCRLCGEEFTSSSLSRSAYLLFPGCPRCGRPHWHNGIESGPVSTLLRFFTK